MSLKILQEILILLNVWCTYGQIREAEYECGVHGRFEYCIDGIPGCVIGCHCHPGFYFDTDTKICEPNIKLTQNFRRQYQFIEPTRAHYDPVTPPESDEPTTKKNNAVDEKIDEMTKDVDDLGDWLYNQFFKTIENQVINETKNESITVKDKGIITRRSGSDLSFLEKPSRRSHKYWKGRKKKKRKNKRKGLKSKLLRITEDDSLFDSNSGSTSDESSDSSDESSSESNSDDSSDRRKKKKSSSDHGHKKIIMMNKRPRPPLPSFIFLPNMETPFFPPIGLPPPAMPMYPMVPVPPMMPPFYPYPGATQHTNDADGETTTSTSTAADTTNGHTTNGHVSDVPVTTVTTEIDTPEESVENLPAENEENKEAETVEPPALRTRPKSRVGPRHKLMQKLRNKLKMKNKLQNHFANEYLGPEPPFTDVNMPPNCLPNPVPNHHKPLLPQINMADELEGPLSGLQDVDFKYLSQLIHKADLNKTNHGVPKEPPEITITQRPPSRRNYYDNYPNDITQVLNNLANQPVKNVPNLPIYHEPQPYHNVPYRKKIENTNDTYYANLGRQIASMIRNIDADKEVDIEIEKSNSKVPSSSLFNGNSYGSRSYWERSVRSPLKYLMKSLKNEMNYLKKSNENLFSLENQVEIAASTEPTLGLQELENIIRQMEKAKSKLKHGNSSHAASSRTSLNVNLLPGNERSFYYEGTGNKKPNSIESNFNSHNYNMKTGKETDQNQLRPQFGNINIKRTNLHPMIQPEYKDTDSRKHYEALEPIFKNVNTRRQNFPFHIEPKNTLESPILPVPKDTLQPSFQPEVKSFLQSPMQLEHKNTLISNFGSITQDTFGNGSNTEAEKNYAQVLFPTRKPNTFIAPHPKMPNNFYYSHAYTVLPLPQKLQLAQKPPIIKNFNIPSMAVTTGRTHYRELNPVVVNQNNLNYYSGNNNPYLFEKTSMPLKFRSFSSRVEPLGGRVEPSYFRHEIHHFDYFDI